MINMLENFRLYLNKESFEYAGIPNVTDAVHSIRSLNKLLSSYRDRGLSKHRQKCTMPE